MNKSLIAGLGIFVGFSCFDAIHCSAELVTCTLDNVVFTDGGTASGSFQLDTVAQTVSAFDFTTTDGLFTLFPGLPIIPGSTYNNSNSNTFIHPADYDFAQGATSSSIEFVTTAEITGPGQFDLVMSGNNFSNETNGPLTEERGVSSGVLDVTDSSVTSTPEPSGLLATVIPVVAILGLVAYRRRMNTTS